MSRQHIPSITGDGISSALSVELSPKVLHDALFPSGTHGPEFQLQLMPPSPSSYNFRPTTPSFAFPPKRRVPPSAPAPVRPSSSWRDAADLRGRELSSRAAGRPFTADQVAGSAKMQMAFEQQSLGEGEPVFDSIGMYLPGVEGGLEQEASYQDRFKARLALQRGLKAVSTAGSRPAYTNSRIHVPNVVIRSKFPPRPPYPRAADVNDYPEIAALVQQEEAMAEAAGGLGKSECAMLRNGSLEEPNQAPVSQLGRTRTTGELQTRGQPWTDMQPPAKSAFSSPTSSPPPSPTRYRQQVAMRARQAEEWQVSFKQHMKRVMRARSRGQTEMQISQDLEIERMKMRAERMTAAQEKAAESRLNRKEQAKLIANAPIKVEASLTPDFVSTWESRKHQLASQRKEHTQRILNTQQAEMTKFRETQSRTMKQLKARSDPETEEKIKKKIEGRRLRKEYDQQKHRAEMAEFKERLRTAPPKTSAFLTPQEKEQRDRTNRQWAEKKFVAMRAKQDRDVAIELRRRALMKQFEAQREEEEEIKRQKASPYAVPIVRR